MWWLMGMMAALLGALALRRCCPVRFVEINPTYRKLLADLGLLEFESFLGLPTVIISGHPDRHVARTTLGTGANAIAVFLKREHVVRWRDRLASAWAGFGFASKSFREAQTLCRLQAAGIGCAEWVAVGEDGRGRAFLLLRELEGMTDLQQFLREAPTLSPCARRRLACRLGEALASVHRAGIDQPDLYAKHVFVRGGDLAIAFLDWQRSCFARRVKRRHRCRDLAALDATLAEELATSSDRLLCLRAYLRRMDGQAPRVSRYRLGSIVAAVCRHSRRLLTRRHIRKERRFSLPLGKHGILWLDGEAFCVLQDFWEELSGQLPKWLEQPFKAIHPARSARETRRDLPGEKEAVLISRRRDEPLRWLWSTLRRRPFVSVELRQAGVLVRRRREGLPGPRVLAFGQRRPLPWRIESFLLTQVGAGEGREA